MAWLHEEHSSPRINWAQTFGSGKKTLGTPKKMTSLPAKKKVQFCRGGMELIWKSWSSSLFYFPCWLFFSTLPAGGFKRFLFSPLPGPWRIHVSKKLERLQIVSTNCTYELREELERNNSDLYIVYIYTHLRWFCHPFVKVIISKFEVQVLSFYEHLPTTIDFHTLGHFFWFSKCFFLIFRICGGIKLQPSGNKGRNSCCDRVGFPLILLIQCEERRLGGGFTYFFIFTRIPGEMIHID